MRVKAALSGGSAAINGGSGGDIGIIRSSKALISMYLARQQLMARETRSSASAHIVAAQQRSFIVWRGIACVAQAAKHITRSGAWHQRRWRRWQREGCGIIAAWRNHQSVYHLGISIERRHGGIGASSICGMLCYIVAWRIIWRRQHRRNWRHQIKRSILRQPSWHQIADIGSIISIRRRRGISIVCAAVAASASAACRARAATRMS